MRMMTTDDAMAVHFGLSLQTMLTITIILVLTRPGNCGITVSQVIRATPSDTLSMIEVTFLQCDVLLFNLQENVISLSVYVRKRQIPTDVQKYNGS